MEISELRGLEVEKERLEEELNAAKLKNGKMLVKVKSLTKELETMRKKTPSPSSSGFDDLDRALEEELKAQTERAQKEAVEARKELEGVRQEKEGLARRVEVVEQGMARMVELKEKQDYEMEFLSGKNRELASQVSGLEWSLEEVEERREQEVGTLTAQLASFSCPEGPQEAGALRLQLAAVGRELEGARGEERRLRQELGQEQRSRQEAEQEAAQVRSRGVDLQD